MSISFNVAQQLLIYCLPVRAIVALSSVVRKRALFNFGFLESGKFMSSVSSIATASDMQMDYMKLLVTQLRNQNPLEPLDNNDMAAQLAQFSQLQQLESMNTSFAKILATTERTYANSLIDRDITFLVETEGGDFEEMNGTVKEVFNDPKGEIVLMIETDNGTYTLGLGGVISVKNYNSD